MLTGSDLTPGSHMEQHVRSWRGLGARAWDLLLIGTSDLATGVFGHHLTMRGRLVTVGIIRSRLNHEDTWMASSDWTLGDDRLVGWTYVYGSPMFANSGEPKALFREAFYLSPMASSCLLCWPFALI